MLAYLQLLCNCFPACPTPARRGPAAASRRPWDRPRWVASIWHMLDLASPACIQRSLCAARRTRAPLSTLHHHLTRMYSPMQRSAPRIWWTLQAFSLCHPHGPHTPASAACSRPKRGYLKAPERSAAVILEPRGVRHTFGSPYGRGPLVPTGEDPLYLRERTPCTYGRGPLVPTGEDPCTYGRGKMI